MAPLNNWQKDYKTWPERMNFIKQKENLADFKFIIGPEKTVFHAHKLIFAISSPDFENLFYLLGSDLKEICRPDISSKSFEEFLNFVYNGTVKINLKNVGDLLKLSRSYDMTLLTDICDKYLIQIRIGRDNVFQVLENSHELPEVESKCLRIIGENYDELFQSAEFIKISKSSLQKIIEYEMLPCKEFVLFQAVSKWAESGQLNSRSENKRAIIDDLIPKIRFNSMTLEEFVKCSVEPILKSSKNANVVKYLASPMSSNPFFLKQKRLIHSNLDELKMQTCFRFDEIPSVNDTLRGKTEFFVTVDKHVYLCGYGFYGRTLEAFPEFKTSEVTISLLENEYNLLSEKVEEITFDGTARIFKIFFDSPILLEPFKSYNIYIFRDATNNIFQSIRGNNGKTEIKENGVTFKLTKSNDPAFERDLHINTATQGPIAALFFKN